MLIEGPNLYINTTMTNATTSRTSPAQKRRNDIAEREARVIRYQEYLIRILKEQVHTHGIDSGTSRNKQKWVTKI